MAQHGIQPFSPFGKSSLIRLLVLVIIVHSGVFLVLSDYFTLKDIIAVTAGEGSTSLPNIDPKTFEELSPLYRQTRVKCSALFFGDGPSLEQAIALTKHPNKEQRTAQAQTNVHQQQEMKPLAREWLINATKDCEWYKQARGYITSPLTRDEEDFPIAYSILIYKDLEMVERLFRMIYRPQNRYCIHVDLKADETFYSTIQSLAACFPGSVRMANRRVKVTWGTLTVLEPELVCMQDLWDMDEETVSASTKDQSAAPRSQEGEDKNRQKKKWKYLVNLTGQEFPLKTNHELVQIMKALRGADHGGGTRKRFQHRYKAAPPPPHGIKATKGGVHVLLNRATVDFILHSKIAKDFLVWTNKTTIPDETFFPSIIFNPHLNVPGSYNGSLFEKLPSLMRHKVWDKEHCANGRMVRRICILSTGDLPKLGISPALFANKFFLREDRVVIGCLEEKLFNDTREAFLGRKAYDTDFYAQQDFVKNQVPHHVVDYFSKKIHLSVVT